jgi:hypothetical protein
MGPIMENTNLWKKGILAAAMGAALGVTGGVKSCEHERMREACIPLGFAEFSQIERDVMEKGIAQGEAEAPDSVGFARTFYFAGLNDLTMKIFECWNQANETGGNVSENFANNLKTRFDSQQKKHHYELEDLFKMVPEHYQAFRKQLFSMHKISESAPSISNLLNNTWNAHHHDEYHTEFYLESVTTTDSDGNSHTHLEPRTRRVYDYTDHEYFYHPAEGNNASVALDELIDTVKDIRLKEEVILPSKINKGGEEAARNTIKTKKDKPLSDEELRKAICTWSTGGTFSVNEQKVYAGFEDLKIRAKQWHATKETAQDTSYRTNSSSDRGPAEFQITYATRDSCNNLLNTVNEALAGVDEPARKLPELREKIDRFVTMSPSDKKYAASGKEVLALTQDVYQSAFKAGFEVDRFRAGMVALWSVLGTLAGAGIGVGANLAASRLARSREGENPYSG